MLRFISGGIMLVTSLFLLNCSFKKEESSNILIAGKGFNKDIKRIYLADAYKWETLLDSAECNNGNFTIKYHPSIPFEPFLATIFYKNFKGELTPIYIRNEIQIKQDGKNHSHSSFFLDYGTTLINYYGFAYGVQQANLIGGNEQNMFQRYNHINITGVPKTKNNQRQERIAGIMRFITDNSKSYFLLGKLIQDREQYSKSELQQLMSSFDSRIQNSKTAAYLHRYIDNSLNEGENTRTLKLTSSKGIITNNINNAAKLNMLIFWASWCGPCRLELPQLKIINKSVGGQDFYMASISIDKDKKKWIDALETEKLQWDQFIVQDSLLEKTYAEYGFSAIPLVIFTNKSGKELARFSGYSEEHINDYKKVINENLNLNLK